MSTQNLRQEFEDWLMEVHGLEAEWQAERNCFREYPAHLAYQAWQASRAALVIDLPQQSGVNLDWNQAIRYCHQAIEAAGVRVKA